MARVMVTGVCGAAGSSIAGQLKTSGHWVLGVDGQRPQSRYADAGATVSAPTAPGYLWELRGLVARHAIEVLIPTVSEELVLMSEARDGFAPGVDVLIADPAPVRTANDTYLTMTCLSSAGVSVPRFGLPRALGTVHEAMDRLGGPLVVKPRTPGHRGGVRLLKRTYDAGAHAARVWATLDDSWIVQRYAPGAEYASMLHCSGALPWPQDSVVVLEKSASKTGLSVSRAEVGDEVDVAHVAGSAAHALGITGPLSVDVRRLPDGTPVVLNVNAGFGAHSAHAPELLESAMGRYGASPLVGRP